MKEGFIPIPNLSTEQNELLRKAFNMPETTYISTKEPTADSLKLGEFRIYNDGTNKWIYTKTSKTDIEKIPLKTDWDSMVIENRTSDPDSPVVGRIWYRTDL